MTDEELDALSAADETAIGSLLEAIQTRWIETQLAPIRSLRAEVLAAFRRALDDPQSNPAVYRASVLKAAAALREANAALEKQRAEANQVWEDSMTGYLADALARAATGRRVTSPP